MNHDCDVCVIGSGAGGGPVALRLAQAGRSVIVIEKGPWLTEKDFFKDEIAACRRYLFTPKPWEEPQSVEMKEDDHWSAEPTPGSGWDFWNGSLVGGASNIMSGFFQRMKPDDFRLKSVFGPVANSTIEDWPISYHDLEPYYDLVEREVGVSGRVVPHPQQEPRSSPQFPFPPVAEHPLAQWIDEFGPKHGYHPIPLARAILPFSHQGRYGCSYSGFCGNYGCATGAKGSSRAALLDRAVAPGKCLIKANCTAVKIHSDAQGRARHLEYRDQTGNLQRISAKIFVVACQPIETSRLLFLSSGPKHSHGLGNNRGQLGLNLIFSSGGSAEGTLPYSKFSAEQVKQLRSQEPFINRSFQDWYYYTDPQTKRRCKGGNMDLMFVHPNPIGVASWYALNSRNKLLWGKPLKRELEKYFREARHLMFEVFCDWTPTANCRVSLDPTLKDKWGVPVARVRIDQHPRNQQTAEFVVTQAKKILTEFGAEDIETTSSGSPSTNLVAGACRFGKSAESSVLDPDCRLHDCENVFVSDGSFMPTGGSVPFTWTVYANSFRVAERIKAQV